MIAILILVVGGTALGYLTGRDMREDARKDEAVKHLFRDPYKRDDRS